MRVLVFVHEYPPVGGGGGRVAQQICQGLAARGHEVRVLTAHYADLPRQQRAPGMEIWRLPSCRTTPYKADFKAMACYVAQAIRYGWWLARRWRPDVLHAHFAVPAGAAAWVLSRLLNLPYVITAHLGDVPGGVPEKTQRWFRWVYPLTIPIWRHASAITAVSQHTRALAQAHYRDVAVEVIPNGVDVERLRPARVRVHEPPRIVFAGRFTQQKNPQAVVRALAQVDDLPWQATLIGDGPLRPKVETLLAETGLATRVTLTGWITPEAVLEIFERSDLLFMPSQSEGLPVVGLQALAKGLAIIASQVGGFVDLVEEGRNGHLFPPGDLQAAVKALRRVLTSRERLLAYRKASLQHARHFDLTRIVAAYESVFHRVLRRPMRS